MSSPDILLPPLPYDRTVPLIGEHRFVDGDVKAVVVHAGLEQAAAVVPDSDADLRVVEGVVRYIRLDHFVGNLLDEPFAGFGIVGDEGLRLHLVVRDAGVTAPADLVPIAVHEFDGYAEGLDRFLHRFFVVRVHGILVFDCPSSVDFYAKIVRFPVAFDGAVEFSSAPTGLFPAH